MIDFSWGEWLSLGLLMTQVPATLQLLMRLAAAPFRPAPLQPEAGDPQHSGRVSVLVPTLNEAERIDPCLEGLHHQGSTLREVVVIDSRSQDETVAKVLAMQARDPRFRVVTDDPLPSGWVGRPWALHSGYLAAHPESDWILGIDADTRPQAGLVDSLLKVAMAENFDVVTLAPRFILKHWGEAWLQPSLLVTLIYRFGAVGDPPETPERTMANGQCCLIRKSVLSEVSGYSLARHSFCDDVTLVRALAARGLRVGFLDGSCLIQVRMYTSLAETWREWGRSLDLKDASPAAQVWSDAWFLLMVQGIPLPLTLGLSVLRAWASSSWLLLGLWALNGGLVLFRWGLLLGIRHSYANPPWTFWLSPLADPLAVLRIILSSLQKPRRWRGRSYVNFQPNPEEAQSS
ncbi:MAG: glycosyltransferase family 2 protein [Cyanobacteriota bacterium]|nr:glycosyltransferase family 2 protein [Cyanobacteriota bacterium]